MTTLPIMLVHGAWVTVESWRPFRRRYEDAGFAVHTPSWPLIEGLSAEQVNAAVPAGFGSLSLGRIADHLEAYARTLPVAPLLIGHSFGGLLVQMLLDRGIGAAGVVLNPAPIGGIVPDRTAISAITPIVARWRGWARPYAFTRARFGARFATGAPEDLIDHAYASYVIPAPGMIFHQAATWLGSRVDPARRTQPLLITSGDRDRLISPHLSRAAFALQSRSGAPTALWHFKDRSHLLIGEPGWEEVADVALDWARQVIDL